MLRESGVTEEALAEAGLSEREAERLRTALYVYSQGFLSLMGEAFAGRRGREDLLKRVWAGFAAFLETAEVAGSADGASPPVSHASAMAAQQRDHAARAGGGGGGGTSSCCG